MTQYPCDGPMHEDGPANAEFSVQAFETAETKFLCPLCFACMGYELGVQTELFTLPLEAMLKLAIDNHSEPAPDGGGETGPALAGGLTPEIVRDAIGEDEPAYGEDQATDANEAHVADVITVPDDAPPL